MKEFVTKYYRVGKEFKGILAGREYKHSVY